MRNKKRLFKLGFTIIELLVVVLIIGLIAGVALLSYSGITGKAVNSAIQSDLTNANIYLKLYNAENDIYPSSLGLINNGNGVSSTVGNVYSYTVSSNGKQYCLASSNGTTAYHIINGSAPAVGGCINTEGLVLDLDAANPTSYPGSGTTWYDLTGNVYNGALNGGPVYDKSNGGIFIFNGNNNVTFSNYSQPNYDSTTSFTWCVWVYGTRNTTEIVLGNRYPDNVMWGSNPSPLSFNKLTSNTWEYYSSSFGPAIPVGTWSYITLVKDGTALRYYRNGTLVASNTSTFTKPSQPFYIAGESNERAAIKVSNVSVYNRALDQTQITANYNAFKSRF